MRTIITVFTAAALALTLSACNSAESLLDEPYEASPYHLYPAPENAYVGDTMPM